MKNERQLTREIKQIVRKKNQLTVKSYHVVRSGTVLLPDGTKLLHQPLSHPFLSRRKAKIHLKHLLPAAPDAILMRYDAFFSPTRPGDYERRRAHIQTLQQEI